MFNGYKELIKDYTDNYMQLRRVMGDWPARIWQQVGRAQEPRHRLGGARLLSSLKCFKRKVLLRMMLQWPLLYCF